MTIPTDQELTRIAYATHKVIIHNDTGPLDRVMKAMRPEYEAFFIMYIWEIFECEGVADVYIGSKEECCKRIKSWEKYGLTLSLESL